MQKSPSEPWENQVKPLKIKSALTRKGSKSKLRGPREFSPVIGSTKPRKAVTFDRTDEVITYEEMTPELHDDWKFNDQSFEVVETFEENPLHTLPAIPEQRGIDKSVSEPSLHATLNEHRMSRIERMDAVIDSVRSPSFRPGHKHKDSWRGSWGAITDSLGEPNELQTDTGYSPHVEDNYLFEQLPAVTRKESLQDEQRRPKTVSMKPSAPPKITLERTHSQRKRAIRSLLGREGSSNIIPPIAEEEYDGTEYASEEEDVMPPELPPHSPIPEETLSFLRPNHNLPRPTSISPSLESVATFEANFGSVERARSSTPILTSFDIPQKLNEEDFDFEKTRTSTPTAHQTISQRAPSPIDEDEGPGNGHDPSDDSSHGDVECSSQETPIHVPDILAPIAPSSSPLPQSLALGQKPCQVETDRSCKTGWEKTLNHETIEEGSTSPTQPLSNDPGSKVEGSKEMGLDLPEIPDKPVQQINSMVEEAVTEYNEKDIALPELSMSPQDFDAHMFDSSGTSTPPRTNKILEYPVSENAKVEETIPVLVATSKKPLTVDESEVLQNAEGSILPQVSPDKRLELNELSKYQDFALNTMPPSNSQVSIAGSGTYDFNSSTIAVHEKCYTAPVRPAVVEEETGSLIDNTECQNHLFASESIMPQIVTQETGHPEPTDDEVDQILENSITQDDIDISIPETREVRPHPEFSFTDHRNITPLTVASPEVFKEEQEKVTTADSSLEEHQDPATTEKVSRSVSRDEESTVACSSSTHDKHDNDAGFSKQDIYKNMDDMDDMEVTQSMHDSTSIEPLVIRPMDISTNEAVNNRKGKIIDTIQRDPSTNMISPPTPSLAYSNHGSRVASGASVGNNTVLHTPFSNDSVYGGTNSTSNGLRLSDESDQSCLQEKNHSPMLIQDELVLDSDLSDDYGNPDDNNDWVTDIESEVGSRYHISGSTMVSNPHSSHIPDRIPTLLSRNAVKDPLTDISATYNSTGVHSQVINGLGFGTNAINTASRWSIESLREDSFLSMQLGQSIDEFSTDLARVASTTVTDGIEADSGYVLRESDSLITANADRIFKTNRRKINSRRRTVSVLENLETHQEDPAEEVNDTTTDFDISVRKRNEQTSFASRQPSHIVMGRNATPQKAYRSTSSQILPGRNLSQTDKTAIMGMTSSPCCVSHENSVISAPRYPSNVGIELPNRADAEVKPLTKITDCSSPNEFSICVDEHGMLNMGEEGEKAPAGGHKPRPASSYTPSRDPQIEGNISANVSSATTETYRNRHKSCPVFPQEKGHFFVIVESVSGYELPDGSMTITLDNGEQQITTEPKPIGKVTEFKEEYDLMVHDGLTCDITIRAFKNETREKRSSFAKIFKRRKENQKQYTTVSSDGTVGKHKIAFSDIKQYAFGKSYSAVLPCYDRMGEKPVCQITVRMMYVPMMSRDDTPPATMKDALEEIAVARRSKVTAMTGYMTQHGGDCRKPKRRYFILDDDMLIAHSDQSFKARATINLRKAVYLAPDENDPLKFRVNFRNGAFINFTVESERQKWMEALDTTIHNKRNRSSWLSLVLYANEKLSTDNMAGAQSQTVI